METEAQCVNIHPGDYTAAFSPSHLVTPCLLEVSIDGCKCFTQPDEAKALSCLSMSSRGESFLAIKNSVS